MKSTHGQPEARLSLLVPCHVVVEGRIRSDQIMEIRKDIRVIPVDMTSAPSSFVDRMMVQRCIDGCVGEVHHRVREGLLDAWMDPCRGARQDLLNFRVQFDTVVQYGLLAEIVERKALDD